MHSWIVSNCCPRNEAYNCGNSQKSQGAKSGGWEKLLYVFYQLISVAALISTKTTCNTHNVNLRRGRRHYSFTQSEITCQRNGIAMRGLLHWIDNNCSLYTTIWFLKVMRNVTYLKKKSILTFLATALVSNVCRWHFWIFLSAFLRIYWQYILIIIFCRKYGINK